MTKFFKSLRKYLPYAIYAARCELKKEVYGSYLNWIWWILEPLSFMLVYMLIFGYFLNCQEKYFETFIFIGLTVWNFFNKTACASVRLLKTNKNIISKVFVPKYIFVIEKMLVNAFKMCISFVIVAFLMLIFRIPVTFNILFFLPLFIPLVLITFGFSCILMHFGAFILDLKKAIMIFLRLVFYVTGVFYSLKRKAGLLGVVLENANPLAFIISSMRSCLIYSATPNIWGILIWTYVGFVLSYFGLSLIQKNENSYAKVI